MTRAQVAEGDSATQNGALADALVWSRLARTAYFVLPKLAIMAMPEDWRARFETLLREAEDAGLSTPEYQVLRDDGQGGQYTRAYCVNPQTGFVRIVKGPDDPWANYKYGDVRALCPKFKL